MAQADPIYTTDTTRGFYLRSTLVEVGTALLTNIFEVEVHNMKPPSLGEQLKKHERYLYGGKLFKKQGKNHKVNLNPGQKKTLYPPNGDVPDTAHGFDISLLEVLLKDLVWLELSRDAPYSSERDRLRRFRNDNYGHISSTSLCEGDFVRLWEELTDILVALGGDRDKISERLNSSIDPELEEMYLNLLEKLYKDDMELKDLLLAQEESRRKGQDEVLDQGSSLLKGQETLLDQGEGLKVGQEQLLAQGEHLKSQGYSLKTGQDHLSAQSESLKKGQQTLLAQGESQKKTQDQLLAQGEGLKNQGDSLLRGQDHLSTQGESLKKGQETLLAQGETQKNVQGEILEQGQSLKKGQEELKSLLEEVCDTHRPGTDSSSCKDSSFRTGSPQPSTGQQKRKGKRRRQKEKKPSPRREEELSSPVPVPVGAAGTEYSSLTDVFQKSVEKYYELKLTHFKPLIWNDKFTVKLCDIFTQLELIPTSEKNNRSEFMWAKQIKELKSLDDLFNPDVTGLSTAPRCILIEGEAGGGKTTFLSKEALDAVSQKTELGRRHSTVLFIRLRELRKGETIEEMVWDQCVPETAEGIDVQSIRTILQRNESRVLFLLDGYDELRPEARAAGQAIPKLLSGKLYPNSTIVITSRPSAGVQQYTRPDCHVRIMGFSPEHMLKYVRKYFIRDPELAEDFIGKYFTISPFLNQKPFLNDQKLSLIQIPMFLMLVCLLWEEDQELVSTGTMTGLYNNLLTFLVRKYCKREGVDMPTEGLPTEVAESLLQFGKLALEALLRNETLLDLTEVEKEKVNWELLLKLGVVSLEVSSSKLHPRKQLNFSHKTMQEFLAGRYVAHALVNQDIVELLQLTSITKALKLSNLLQFTCGCDSRAAQAVTEELSKISNRRFTHLRPEQFERSNMPKDRDLQKFCKTYERFASSCLNILSERQEPKVFQGISQALPIVVLDSSINSREATGLKYYIQNLHSANLPDRLILKVPKGTDSRDTVQYLQQCFTTSLPGLELDLKLSGLFDSLSGQFDSPDETARLVSVLKNVPGLRALALSDTYLTPSSLQPLVQGFSHMSLLEELDLAENPELGDAGLEVLQVGLSSAPRLAVLRLQGVNMTAVGMSSLAPYMRHLVGLRVLDISKNFKIGDTGLESLTTILPIFTAMQVLVLEWIGISPIGWHTLVPALCQLTRLIKLDINDNVIGDPGLEYLASILHHLTAMKVLVLRKTGISDRGISSLIKTLPHLVQLQVLDVSGNYIGDSGIVSLVQTLCQPSSLDMEQNPPGDKSLTTAPHCNNTLQKLDIGGNRGVTGAGLGRVAQLISALPALTILDMSGNPWDTPVHLSDTAAMALAEALPRLPALEWLVPSNISMEPAGFQAVVQAAEEHPTLEWLCYSKRGVPEGADTTASCLTLF